MYPGNRSWTGWSVRFFGRRARRNDAEWLFHLWNIRVTLHSMRWLKPFQPVQQTRAIQSTGYPVHFYTVLEQHQGWDTADLELTGQQLLLLRIDFGKTHPAFKLRRSLGEYGSHHLAWAAPGCPEIHHDRHVGFPDKASKSLLGKFDRQPIQNRGTAFAAFRILISPLRRHPVYGLAMCAHDVHCPGNLSWTGWSVRFFRRKARRNETEWSFHSKELQRRHVPKKPCNPLRSELTNRVKR